MVSQALAVPQQEEFLPPLVSPTAKCWVQSCFSSDFVMLPSFDQTLQHLQLNYNPSQALWLEKQPEITAPHSCPLFPRQKFPRPVDFRNCSRALNKLNRDQI